jgi:hypothetical protein
MPSPDLATSEGSSEVVDATIPAVQSAPVKWICIVLLAACQKDSGGDFDPAYVRDVERLCNVVEMSGAAGMELADRTYVTATWLGQNLESPAGKALLAAIQPLDAANKAKALETEAGRVGIASCPLAADWKRPR